MIVRAFAHPAKRLSRNLPSPAGGRGAGGEGSRDRRGDSKPTAATARPHPNPFLEGEGTSQMGSMCVVTIQGGRGPRGHATLFRC